MPKKSFAQLEMQYSFSITTSLYNQATQAIVQIVSRAIAGGLVDRGLNTADSEAGGGDSRRALLLQPHWSLPPPTTYMSSSRKCGFELLVHAKTVASFRGVLTSVA